MASSITRPSNLKKLAYAIAPDVLIISLVHHFLVEVLHGGFVVQNSKNVDFGAFCKKLHRICNALLLIAYRKGKCFQILKTTILLWMVCNFLQSFQKYHFIFPRVVRNEREPIHLFRFTSDALLQVVLNEFQVFFNSPVIIPVFIRNRTLKKKWLCVWAGLTILWQNRNSRLTGRPLNPFTQHFEGSRNAQMKKRFLVKPMTRKCNICASVSQPWIQSTNNALEEATFEVNPFPLSPK